MSFPCSELHHNTLYKPLINGRRAKNDRRGRRRANSAPLVLMLFGAVVVVVVGLRFSRRFGELSKSHDDRHTIPTLLSVVDPDTGRFLYALDVPLYKAFRNALSKSKKNLSLRRSSPEIQVDAPKLSLDRMETSVRQPLTLSWSMVKDDDIVSLHCPHDSPHHIFQDVATMAQVQATSRRSGGGDPNSWFWAAFPILRQETCQFRLFRSTSNNHVELLAVSPTLHIRDSSRTPTGLHLAFSNDTSQVVVQFITGEEGTPVAMYGINETTTKAEGTSHTYQASDMCQAPANVTETGKFQPPGILHVVTLTELEPNTDAYQYKVGLAGPQGIVWSDTFQFHSAPLVGDTKEFSYIVYGDQGCPSVGWGDGGVWTSAMAARESAIRFVHHFGDLSYARGAAHIWDEWLNMIQSFAAHVPLLIGVGNHEYDHTSGGENGKDPSGLNSSHGFMPAWGNMGDDSGGECGVPTAKRFTVPASNGSNGVFWYSHEYASVHTAFISSEHNLTKGSPQYIWLEADLRSVNRTRTPWLVVESHRPLYESEAYFDQAAVCVGMRYQIEDLLKENNVDLVLAGHYHMYQ